LEQPRRAAAVNRTKNLDDVFADEMDDERRNPNLAARDYLAQVFVTNKAIVIPCQQTTENDLLSACRPVGVDPLRWWAYRKLAACSPDRFAKIVPAMYYIKVKWIHADPEGPVWLYSELDEDRWEMRKVEIFADGTIGFASSIEASDSTGLGLMPVPTLIEISASKEFEPQEITKEEFEQIWSSRLMAR
jgi:hypothetical protein